MHTQHAGLKLVQHTPCLLTVTRPREGEISTIVPVSRVGGAKRQSPGRAAGCTAPRRAACPGRHSCSRLASGHWASGRPRAASAVRRHRFECTESRKNISTPVLKTDGLFVQVVEAYLSPNAVVPQRAWPRVAALGLGWFDPLIAVAVAASVGVLADHHSPLEAPRTGAGTLQRRTSAR